jgi:hypothetical protein
MITISPENPTTASDVTFTFKGGSACPVTTQTVDGNEFVFEVQNDPAGPCLSAPVPYTFTWRVGNLEEGQYQVTHIDSRAGGVSEQFEVGQASAGWPVSIPTMGLAGAAVLVALVAVAASKSLRGD